MAQHTWSLDAPSGVYKNHKLSQQIREASIEKTKVMQFVNPEPGYGKNDGESVSITRIANITEPSDDTLNENTRIPEDELSLSTQQITVNERGRAVPFTSFAVDLAYFDLTNSIQRKLRDQLRLRLDTAAAAAFKSGKVKAIPDGVSSLTFDTDGTASTTATNNLNVFHVEEIRDYLFDTLHTDPAVDDDYVGIISTKAKRGIMRDPAWQEWKKYTDPEAKFNGEVGRIDNIRFVESNHSNAFSSSLGSGSVLGEGVFFGGDAVRMASAKDPELVAKMPEDYGRSKGVAWYGIYGFGQIWDDSANAGEARVVHLTSA